MQWVYSWFFLYFTGKCFFLLEMTSMSVICCHLLYFASQKLIFSLKLFYLHLQDLLSVSLTTIQRWRTATLYPSQCSFKWLSSLTYSLFRFLIFFWRKIGWLFDSFCLNLFYLVLRTCLRLRLAFRWLLTFSVGFCSYVLGWCSIHYLNKNIVILSRLQ